MTSADEVVQLLGRLGDDDRRWILERLPTAAKTRLAECMDGTRPQRSNPASVTPPPDERFEWNRAVARLAQASPAQVAGALEREPAWLVGALLSAASWPWQREVARGLPAGLRVELASLDREHAGLSPPATEFLVRELAQRAEGWPVVEQNSPGVRSSLARLYWRLRR